MRKLVAGTITLYQKILSPFLESVFGKACRFTPTCSQYAKEAVTKYGIFKGGVLAIKRISRCHPLNKGGFDPVPII